MTHVESLPGRWAENLTAWEAKAEPVRFGDHAGRGVREPRPNGDTSGQGLGDSCYRAGANA